MLGAGLVNQSHLELIKTGSAHIDRAAQCVWGRGKKLRHAPLLSSNSQPNPDTPKSPSIGIKVIIDHRYSFSSIFTRHRAYLVVHDLPVGLDKALSVEGGFAVEHLVHADTQRPPVALRTVAALACKMSRFEVLGSIYRTTLEREDKGRRRRGVVRKSLFCEDREGRLEGFG